MFDSMIHIVGSNEEYQGNGILQEVVIWIHFFFSILEGSLKEVLQKLFRLFDVNSDGTISRKEMLVSYRFLWHFFQRLYAFISAQNAFLFQRLVKDLRGLSSSVADKAFEEMDKDKDGSVSW